jgi:hypothetical protein
MIISKMRKPRLILSITTAFAVGAGRWIIASPPKRPRRRLPIWIYRSVAAAAIIWLFAFGPAGLLVPQAFGFTKISGNNINVYYEKHLPSQYPAEVLSFAQQARQANIAFWGPAKPGEASIDIYLFNSRAHWELRVLGSPGNACTASSSIFVSPSIIRGPLSLRQILTHEMSHALLNQRLGFVRGYDVPAWVNEGIATYIAQNFWATDDALRQYLEGSPQPELVRTSQLRSHIAWVIAASGSSHESALTYGHAQSLCAYLIDRFGADHVKDYLDNSSLLVNSNKAFFKAFGMNMDQADDAWLAQAKAAGRVPASAVLTPLRFNFETAARPLLVYAFLAAAFLWIIRQVCFAARFACGHFGISGSKGVACF